MMTVKIITNDKSNPLGKLADAELHFTPDLQSGAFLRALATTLRTQSFADGRRDYASAERCERLAEILDQTGPLLDLKLIGFGIWERRDGGRNVTFPARSLSVNGERRSFAVLRPIADVTAQERIRDLILEAYADSEAKSQVEQVYDRR